MSNSYFRFKQFTVHHDRCAMKVGTDGVLLGAWCNMAEVGRALDVGTGSGLIALMLAQRGVGQVDGVEVDEAAAGQAAENVQNSPFSDCVSIIQGSFDDFVGKCGEKYDLIVSNPPYFTDALRPDDAGRSLARHTGGLSYEAIVDGTCRLLGDAGRLALILPYDHFDRFSQLAQDKGFFLLRKAVVYPKPDSLPKRVLMEWGRVEGVCEEGALVIELERHCYSSAFKALTRDFYLNV